MLAMAERTNGIDVDGLKATMAEVTRDPKSGQAKFRVATQWMGGTKSQTRVTGYEIGGNSIPKNFTIRTDEPVELLGENTAPNPQEVLMSALNACMMVGYVVGCAAKGVKLTSLSIETEGSLDLRGFLGIDKSVRPGYDEVRYVVRMKGDGTPEQMEEVHRTVIATSPNYFNFANPIRMVPKLVVE